MVSTIRVSEWDKEDRRTSKTALDPLRYVLTPSRRNPEPRLGVKP